MLPFHISLRVPSWRLVQLVDKFRQPSSASLCAAHYLWLNM